MRAKNSILSLSLLLLATASLRAQDRVPSDSDSEKDEAVTHAALKGCLSATGEGTYRLAEDESGAVYNLVGSRDMLRLLVGTDVLVTGQDLQTAPNQNPGRIETEADSYPVRAEAKGGNSFRVINAIKLADVCSLSPSQSASLLPQ